MNALPSLVIFDCDGVLVDSETIANEVMAEFITAAGWPMTRDESMATFVGQRMTDVMSAIEAKTGRALPSDWLEQFETARNAAFDTRLRPVPGIGDVLDRIAAAGIPTCVASSGQVSKMRFTLGLTGLAHHFGDRLYSAWGLPRGKPFPDVFLHAAAAMKTLPQDCVVIEDSPAGAQAAQSAGMRCLGYAAAGKANELQAYDATVFFSMDELPGLLGL